jgi:hypothetical protein
MNLVVSPGYAFARVLHRKFASLSWQGHHVRAVMDDLAAEYVSDISKPTDLLLCSQAPAATAIDPRMPEEAPERQCRRDSRHTTLHSAGLARSRR